MKLINNSNFNLLFPKLSGNFGLWLLWMGLSMSTYAQFHVSGNTIISFKEGTVLYVTDKISDETFKNIDEEKVKIYVGQNTQLTNFPTDAHVEIVYQEKESQPKKANETIDREKSKKTLQDTIITKNDTDDEKQSVHSFSSQSKASDLLILSGEHLKAALVLSGNFLVKSFTSKKLYSNIIHTFLLNGNDQKIKTSIAVTLPIQQIHLARKITRPPPVLIKLHSSFA